MRSDAREQTTETGGISGKVTERAAAKDAVGVIADDVVVARVKVSSLHQVDGEEVPHVAKGGGFP